MSEIAECYRRVAGRFSDRANEVPPAARFSLLDHRSTTTREAHGAT